MAEKTKCLGKNLPQCHFKQHEANTDLHIWAEKTVTDRLSYSMAKHCHPSIVITPLLGKNEAVHFPDSPYRVALPPHTCIGLPYLQV
jgi:hypothetical protein